MESNRVIQPAKIRTKVHASELLSVFNEYVDKIKVLSLDCFDTILWRNAAQPDDVFYDLDKNPLFKSLGFSARTRGEAEAKACQLMRVRTGTTQAKLKDIYRAVSMNLSDKQIEDLVEEELTAEIKACYIFPPIIELIHAAAAKQKKIVIVSDTYFEEKYLRRHLESKLPKETMALISKIICSCEFGRSKSEGLLKIVIDKLHVPAKSILHIGDNPIADLASALKLEMNALHLVHHNENIAEMMRMQAIAASYIDSSIRNNRSLSNPFRGLLAAKLLNYAPENLVGYATLGPIMYAFARFICNEVEQLQLAGKRPKVLFLMRDAYLPALVCEKLMGQTIGTNVCISRFSAVAASFRNKLAVENYLAANAKSMRFKDMCTQLLISDEISQPIIQKTMSSSTPVLEFVRQIQKDTVLQAIFKNSSDYRQRLKLYLEKQVGMEAGDTLVFVDLGYTCSTQIALEAVMREEMGVELIGRYLIVLREAEWEQSRRGLLDPTIVDDKVLTLLIHYIPIFEKLCCSVDKSVIDFDQAGDPIYSDIDLCEEQHAVLKSVQAESLRFANDVEAFFQSAGIQLTHEMLKDAAAINLVRMIYFPLQAELDYLKSFKLDVNLGTSEVIPLYDLNKGVDSLRRRGWLHSTKENVKNMRLNYPAEWRSANLELSFAMLTQLRCGFDLSLNDLSHRRQKIPVIFSTSQNTTTQLTLDAKPTFDGYYSVFVPVTHGCQFGVQFGLDYQWVELESAELIKAAHLFGRSEFENTQDGSANLAIDGMEDKGGGLFECKSASSLLVYIPPQHLEKESYVLRIIFRPIVFRTK